MTRTVSPFAIANIGAALNLLPNLYSRIGQLGVFGAPIGIPTANTTVIRRDNKVTLLSQVARNAPSQELNRSKASGETFDIPTFKAHDLLTPSDIQGFTAFQPGPAQLESQTDAYNRRLLAVRQPHDETHEFLRVSALKGVIVDPGTGDELYDLFNVFGIAKKKIYFDLDNDASDIFGHIEELEDHIANNLRGDVTTGPRAMVASDFLRKLKRHPKYEKYLLGNPVAAAQYAASRADASSPNAQRSIQLENTIFESYTGQGNRADGSTVKYISDGMGHAFPENTIQTFSEFNAPPERMGQVNIAPSQCIHVYPHDLPQGKGIDLDSESCKLPLCNQPEVLVELHAGAQP
ncbi:major capsid protein [Litorimonas sp. WD9-15]|uniref:major capsid protein n=1 Tax=Litorimonas sp. WD9-15 TaxID=3418716 RepID=UPI003D070994